MKTEFFIEPWSALAPAVAPKVRRLDPNAWVILRYRYHQGNLFPYEPQLVDLAEITPSDLRCCTNVAGWLSAFEREWPDDYGAFADVPHLRESGQIDWWSVVP